MKKFLVCAWVLPLLISGLCRAGWEDDFMAARDAFRNGDSASLDAYAQRLKGSVLESYVAYWQIRMNLDDADPETVRGFLEQYRDTPIANRLRGDWLRSLGKAEKWDIFSEEYPAFDDDDRELKCFALQARVNRGEADSLDEGRKFWFTGRETPESCAPVFNRLVYTGKLTERDIWSRLRQALEAGNIGLAKKVNEYLPSHRRISEKLMDAATRDPRRYLQISPLNLQSRPGRELSIYALSRVMRSDVRQAYADWRSKMASSFPKGDRDYIMGQLAYQAARRHLPEALEWYDQVENEQLTDLQLEWKIRSALRVDRWEVVLPAIAAMSPSAQEESVWRYWKGRALRVRGNVAEANEVLANLSREYNFYGLLAGEELGSVISAPEQPHQVSREEVKAMEGVPGIQRALALYSLNLRYDGAREWAWATRNFDDKQLLSAAELAKRYELYDRAIATAERTIHLHDFSLRYPVPYRDTVKTYVSEMGLDEALVYGVIRQESRFVANARSSAGASGLMQLMPSTAKWAAKKLGMNDFQPSSINQLNTNMSLGTYYLRYVLDRFDNQPVLASAAYNAGPGRAMQWLGEGQMEGAVYAESIPFNETREYVKKVMSNAVYYADTLGQRFRTLKQWLGVIGGKAAGDNTLQDGE